MHGSDPPPVVVLGGFLSRPPLYRGMCEALASSSGARVEVVPVGLRHWAGAVSSRGWWRILRALDAVVRKACAESGHGKVTLVGHSSGGVMARLYLAPEPFHGTVFAGRLRVSRLVTLGSPHTNERVGGMRRWVDARYPGAWFAPEVSYCCVAGRAIEGNRQGGWQQRAAFRAYRALTGNGAEWGDGLVPVRCALLAGAQAIVLDDVGHAPLRGGAWYGSSEVVGRWWRAAIPPRV